ncbi:hypothetical protein NMY27_08680 [Cronobacter dublinensis subsp. beijingensis]|uniref:hypothetical protein n=1 Tax=Cronobacter dublinensis TaxID=413497 RepID=UPI0023DCB4B6|nr:hypothetical protein [Cronobacter dublinensis]WEP51241.1 hypothetical protein NMY27_08680 [Cronobacter dublinensis]
MADTKENKSAPALLHFRFPVAKDEHGGEFTDCEAFLDHLGRSESGGSWPVGRNGLWHGGIHITNASAPWCALGGPFAGLQPLRNMADGEVVAYRVCSDLKAARWWGKPVPHACSFVLIRHYVQPGETEQSGLTFYTLYMNLAPWNAYSQGDAEHWSINVRCGLNAFADEHRAFHLGALPKGTKIWWNSADPALRRAHGETVMGLVTLQQNVQEPGIDLYAGDNVWVSVRDAGNFKPEYGGPVRPAWWAPLLPPNRHTLLLDSVVCPNPIAIKAGEAIGHLGCVRLPGAFILSPLEEQYQTHIECFTDDRNLANFLTNPEQVGEDKPAFLKFIPNVTAYDYHSWPLQFEPRMAVSTLDTVVRLADARSAKDGVTGQLYWCTDQHESWIRDEDTKKLSRYDLASQGFEQVDIPTTGFKYLGENRSRKGFIRKLIEVLHFAAKQEQRIAYGAMKYEYARLLEDIDAEREYDAWHMLSWLCVPILRHFLNRLIIKHTSEWAHFSHAMWEEEHLSDYRQNEPGEAEYWDTVLKNEVWIPDLDKSKVNLPAELWHMHPVMFLDAICVPKTSDWAHSPFADLICEAESRNDYTAYNRTYPHPNPSHTEVHRKTNLTSMTIAQVMDAQSISQMFATGRYQITPAVLSEAVRVLGLDSHALYDEAVQDKIFEEYIIKIKRPSIIDYLEGDGNVEDAAYACAKEFASVGVKQGKEISPDPYTFETNPDGSFILDRLHKKVHKKRHAASDGIGYYNGDKLNKAFVMPNELIQKLKDSKNGI